MDANEIADLIPTIAIVSVATIIVLFLLFTIEDIATIVAEGEVKVVGKVLKNTGFASTEVCVYEAPDGERFSGHMACPYDAGQNVTMFKHKVGGWALR